MDKILIIGGGISGLICASLLSKNGYKVLVIEKGQYPTHKVCGEYVSNEVIPFLKKNHLYPETLNLPLIHNFKLTSPSGTSATARLNMGGFGISRYRFDEFLYHKAVDNGAEVLTNTQVIQVNFRNDRFYSQLSNGETVVSKWVIGAHGKRSMVDKKLNRSFFSKRSDFLGVKYHIKTDFPSDTIALHNFEGGYCGISKIENEEYNLCYLGTRSLLKQYGSIPEMEQNVLMRNPFLNNLFTNSDFLFSKPLVINEISFRKKLPVENHIFMVGDAAGLITPLCGNGMAMAIHSAKVLSDMFIQNKRELPERTRLENLYTRKWNQLFSNRLWVGRLLQNHLFGGVTASNLAIALLKEVPPLARLIIKSTHGKYI